MTSDYSGPPSGLTPGLSPTEGESTHIEPAGTTKHVALWLLFWFVIALIIRLTNLTIKAAWMDEVATTLFSLGNYSRLIPLNEVISLDQLLRPLQITPGSNASDVVTHLLVEDNHPPSYFVLAHWWMAFYHRWFGSANGYASLWAERALPAFFGALAVPATYLLAWLSFRERTIGLLCAALMAVSPFSVFLSQEARHYSLAILAVIASLCCFVVVVRALSQGKAASWGTVLAWVFINVLGLTIHFFCGLTLMAEGLTLGVMLIQQCWRWRTTGPAPWRRASWMRVYIAAAGTLAGALLWLPILTNFYGSPQTSFLRSGVTSWKYWINPLVQSLASWLYVVLSPVTGGYSWQAVTAIVVSCLVLLGYAIWLVATLRRSFRFQLRQPSLRPGGLALWGFFIMANLLFVLICYSLGFDITRGHRYSFVFFPSVILLVGLSLAPFWQEKFETTTTLISAIATPNFSQAKLPFIQRHISGKRFVMLVIAVGFFGAQVIVQDYSSLKFYKADRLVNLIQADSALLPTQPVIIGTRTTITDQPSVIGIEIMSVGWEIQRHFNPTSPDQAWGEPPRFVIAENNDAEGKVAEVELVNSLEAIARPFDLWLLNMSPDLIENNCTMPTGGGGNKGSFSYTHYVCASAE
ncbi:MAG: phospholipid carrier-dependent glycosyltransferase [Cyanobacteria bacterium P01_F01_bin.53]